MPCCLRPRGLHALSCCDGTFVDRPPVASQVETRITCPLSAMQTFWYRRLLTRDSKMLTNIEAEDRDSSKEKEVNVCCRPRIPF